MPPHIALICAKSKIILLRSRLVKAIHQVSFSAAQVDPSRLFSAAMTFCESFFWPFLMTPLIKGSLAQGGYFLALIGTYRKNGAILLWVKRRTEAASFHAHYIGNWNMEVLTSAGNSWSCTLSLLLAFAAFGFYSSATRSNSGMDFSPPWTAVWGDVLPSIQNGCHPSRTFWSAALRHGQWMTLPWRGPRSYYWCKLHVSLTAPFLDTRGCTYPEQKSLINF